MLPEFMRRGNQITYYSGSKVEGAGMSLVLLVVVERQYVHLVFEAAVKFDPVASPGLTPLAQRDMTAQCIRMDSEVPFHQPSSALAPSEGKAHPAQCSEAHY